MREEIFIIRYALQFKLQVCLKDTIKRRGGNVPGPLKYKSFPEAAKHIAKNIAKHIAMAACSDRDKLLKQKISEVTGTSVEEIQTQSSRCLGLHSNCILGISHIC